ncbi:MAG: hypothetical protein M1830_009552 [Pleopsidium flavum]|nr:MAG: hypothetical protein M1830_009552 [Pleopsidium flavum]
MPATSLQVPNQQNLISVGIFSFVYLLSDTLIRKVPRRDDADSISNNVQAIHNEATIYTLLGDDPHIAKCLSRGRNEDSIDLEYYPNGDLQSYVGRSKTALKDAFRIRLAGQIIEAVVRIHEKGVVHSDLALRQFLLDTDLNARLSDFGASGYPGQSALGMEGASHYLPRNADLPNTVESDLFALGSTLYELMAGEAPYYGLSDETIEVLFTEGHFPSLKYAHNSNTGLINFDEDGGYFSNPKESLDFGHNNAGFEGFGILRRRLKDFLDLLKDTFTFFYYHPARLESIFTVEDLGGLTSFETLSAVLEDLREQHNLLLRCASRPYWRIPPFERRYIT